MLRLQTEEHTSLSLEKQLQRPGCLITVLMAQNFPDSTALSPQGPRKMGKGLPQDPELPHISLLVPWFYTSGDWSLQTRRKQPLKRWQNSALSL